MLYYLYLIFFVITTQKPAYSREKGPREISVSDIVLGNIDGHSDVEYIYLQPPYSPPQISVSLWGHEYSLRDDHSAPMQEPWLIIEESDDGVVWTGTASAISTIRNCDVARVQNLPLDPDKQYRFAIRTNSSQGGRYALVVDPSYPGYEFEVEELDLGTAPNGDDFALSCAYVAELENQTFMVAGTENGYILKSEDGEIWKTIYPLENEKPFPEPLFSVFVDSKGNIYASPWTPNYRVQEKGLHGLVIESRDGGKTWNQIVTTEWPTGVAWRWAEDSHGNVFFGEYSASMPDIPPKYHGNVWRRKNHGNNGEPFEVVFANPNENNDTWANHVHYVGVDPYTDVIYATIGDGGTGRFVCSSQQGEPGTWKTLERGVDSQYTSIAFTPDNLFLGMDTHNMHKKIVKWDKTKPCVNETEPFWTSNSMDFYPLPPTPWTDKGNWFWGQYHENRHTLTFSYMPYMLNPMENGQMQPPRIYASNNSGEFWWRALTFPPGPIRYQQIFGETGPKMSSNLSKDGWIYASRGTTGSIHRGFRFRMKSQTSGSSNWEQYQ